MKKLIPILFIVFAVSLTAQEGQNVKEFESRVQTKVIKLKNITLSNAYRRAVQQIIYNDYDPKKVSMNYDEEDNVLILTATSITLEKIEHFLNKIDVPKESLTFQIYLLNVKDKSSFPKNFNKDIIKELKNIDVSGAEIMSNPRIKTLMGKKIQFKTGSIDKEWFQVSFYPTGSKESLILERLEISRLIKDKAKGDTGEDVFREWNVLETSLLLENGKPAIIGVSQDGTHNTVLAITLVK